MITETSRRTMIAAAANLHPNETGGILIGVLDETGAPCITEAVELRPRRPSTHRYDVPEGHITAAVDAARDRDPRVGYVGEWHSHPTDQPASATDHATMRTLAAHPDTGNPVLLVVRPTGRDTFTLDAHMSLHGGLLQVPLIDVGPITSEDSP